MNAVDTLAKNIRAIRNNSDLTQEELAYAAGLHRTYVSQLERGKRNPTVEVIDRIAQALGVPACRLLDEES